MERLTPTLDEQKYGAILTARLPRIITSPDAYQHAAAELEAITFDDSATAEEQAYAEILTLLLAAYDDQHPPFGAGAKPAQILAHLLDQASLTQTDLASIVGSRAYASQLLSGKRGISRRMAAKLAAALHVDAALFFGS